LVLVSPAEFSPRTIIAICDSRKEQKGLLEPTG
jgi:hypothetical protein